MKVIRFSRRKSVRLPYKHCSRDRRLGLRQGTLARSSGVVSRHLCVDEDQIDMATRAAQTAIDKAGINLHDTDFMLGAAASHIRRCHLLRR